MRAPLVLAVVAVLAAAAAGASADPVVPSPRGSREIDGRVRSGADLRRTTAFLERAWRDRRLAVRKVGPIHRAGVELVRYLPTGPAPWAAVHVYRVAGVTWIAVVPVPLDAPAATE
ncbi:MAG: hypothetical protein R3B06_31965 [Kofleriaceae bacterium]